MTVVSFDIDSIGGGIAGITTACIAIYSYLSKKGYIYAWKKKLSMSLEVAEAAHKQNGNALNKLNMPDDILCVLNSFEVNEKGQVVLKGEGRVNKLLTAQRPLTLAEKDEIINTVRKVLISCNDQN